MRTGEAAMGQEKGWERETGRSPDRGSLQWVGGDDGQGGRRTKRDLKILRLGNRTNDGNWEETVWRQGDRMSFYWSELN